MSQRRSVVTHMQTVTISDCAKILLAAQLHGSRKQPQSVRVVIARNFDDSSKCVVLNLACTRRTVSWVVVRRCDYGPSRKVSVRDIRLCDES